MLKSIRISKVSTFLQLTKAYTKYMCRYNIKKIIANNEYLQKS